jgi:hypothetical protein
MSVKMTGAQYVAFMNDDVYWANRYFDDDHVTIDGEDLGDMELKHIPVGAKIVIHAGTVLHNEDRNYRGTTLTALARKWLEVQTHTQFMVECPNEVAEQLKALIQTNQGKILK